MKNKIGLLQGNGKRASCFDEVFSQPIEILLRNSMEKIFLILIGLCFVSLYSLNVADLFKHGLNNVWVLLNLIQSLIKINSLVNRGVFHFF